MLAAVARLPIHAWRYRSRPEASHVGPMAQDFAAELGLGADDRVIEAVDASGVALAAIQALLARVDALAERNEALQQRITELEEPTGREVDQCAPFGATGQQGWMDRRTERR